MYFFSKQSIVLFIFPCALCASARVNIYSLFYLVRILHEGGYTKTGICLYIKHLLINQRICSRLHIVRVVLWTSWRRILNDPPWSIAMAMNTKGVLPLALWARFAHANLLQANLSAGDRPTGLFVSSMRFTTIGACAKNLCRSFLPGCSSHPWDSPLRG